jgi:integrase
MKETKQGRPKGTLSYDGGVVERDGVWYARLKWEGRDIRVSSKSPRKSDATELLKQLRKQVRDGTYRPGASRITLADLKAAVVADYKANGQTSVATVEWNFKNLERLLGAETPAAKIGPKIPGYIAKRLAERRPSSRKVNGVVDKTPTEGAKPISAATVNRELAALRRGFNLMVKAGQLATMPTIELLKESGPRKGFPEPEEIEKIIGKLPPRLKGAVRFLSITGWRVNEALNLTWRDADLRAGTLRLEADATKGGEIRTYPYAVHPELKALILSQRAGADAIEAERRNRGDITPVEAVFYQEDGSPNAVYQYAWGRACEAAGYPGRLVHDLRRYAARALVRSGVSETIAMELLGHATPSIFRRYNVTDDRDRRQAVQSLAHATTSTKAKEA